jgi:hypothetical protein
MQLLEPVKMVSSVPEANRNVELFLSVLLIVFQKCFSYFRETPVRAESDPLPKWPLHKLAQ